MKIISTRLTLLLSCGAALALAAQPAPQGKSNSPAAAPVASPAGTEAPAYDAEGNVLLPKNYREWVWLSSGLGMTYNDGVVGAVERVRTPNFTNVFVNPPSYRAFQKSGTWPDTTTMVLEIRNSESQGSINKGGNYQGAVRAIEVEVKDEKKFAGKWAFFAVKTGEDRGKLFPSSADCYTCHARNGAVDNTFVQFYPTLSEIAKQKGTFRQSEEK